MSKTVRSEKLLGIGFNDNGEPQFAFKGAWNIRDLGRVRSTLLRAYKHYMKELRVKEEAINERTVE